MPKREESIYHDDKERNPLDLKPYDRLQAIISEKNAGKLTKTASENLDVLFGVKPKITLKSICEGILNFFKKIDGLIFKNSVYTTRYSKRK